MRALILFLFIISTGFAQKMFIYNAQVKLLDPASKAEVGVIYEGTPVELVKEVGENALIKVKGQVFTDNPKMLGQTKDALVSFLTLKDKNAKEEMEFLVSKKDLTKGEYASWEEIELVYYDTCTSCHAAHKPKEHLMSEWDAYISAMQDFAKITDAEKTRILRFLQAYASDGIATEEE